LVIRTTIKAMSHPQDIDLPDYDSAFAVQQATAAGGDTDTEMTDVSGSSSSSPHRPLSPLDPSTPLYTRNPPRNCDIPAAHLIDLTKELTREGGPLPIAGPYLDIDISKTLALMLDRFQNQNQRFFRLRYAINYLHQGLTPTCKYPGCKSRCRIVDHNLETLTPKMLQPDGAAHLRYIVSDKEHAVFLSVSCNHDDWKPTFAWSSKSVGFRANPVTSTVTYERWATREFFFSRQRDTNPYPGMINAPILSRKDRRKTKG